MNQLNTSKEPVRDAKGIARALRKQLGEMGLDITHAAALELVAKTASVKDWNVLSAVTAQRAPHHTLSSGMYCPRCGQHGQVERVSTAFVEQGPGDEDGYLFEGDAEHHECQACGYQFLDWQSSWPTYESMQGYLLMYQPLITGWQASLYPVGRVCAIMTERGWDLEDIEVSPAADAQEAVRVLDALASRQDAHQDLIGRLGAYGVSAHWQASGTTTAEALRALKAVLPAQVAQAVLNEQVTVG